MPDEHPLTLHQADQARADFYAIESDLRVIQAQIARLPTRRELAQTALGIIIGTAGLVVGWLELFWRACL
jgi:hypothetical protein